jgi:tripeptidyl-peptidase-1
LYQVGDGVTGATFNTFLDALDEIYCAGTKNMGDPVYPSTRNGGFTGQKSCGQFRATSVISISYANNEADLPSSYMSRQCSE